MFFNTDKVNKLLAPVLIPPLLMSFSAKSCRAELLQPRGAFFHRQEIPALSTKNFQRIHAEFTLPEFSTDPNRQYKHFSDENPDRTGPLDKFNVYVGIREPIKRDGSRGPMIFEAGLGYERKFVNGEWQNQYAWLPFMRLPGHVYKKPWKKPVPGEYMPYFNPGESISLDLSLSPDNRHVRLSICSLQDPGKKWSGVWEISGLDKVEQLQARRVASIDQFTLDSRMRRKGAEWSKKSPVTSATATGFRWNSSFVETRNGDRKILSGHEDYVKGVYPGGTDSHGGQEIRFSPALR